MKKYIPLLALFLLILSLGIFINSSTSPERQTTDTKAQTASPTTTVLAKNLEIPWAIDFLPDGNIIFTERPGNVKLLNVASGQVTPVGTIDDVRAAKESGLLGLVLHPQFTTNNFVYVYYTYNGSGGLQNKVVKYTFTNNQLGNPVTIIDGIPGSDYHDGGRLRFGPDGFLYVTTGDATQDSIAQDPNSLGGKILRVTDDGTPAPGNPFNNRTWSYGHRNPQGLAWDGTTMYITEHGPSSPSCCDEVNRIEPGKNYGWPDVTGDQTKAGTEKNLVNSGQNGSNTWAPSGTTFYNGSLFFAGLKGQALYEATIQGDSATIVKQHFKNQFGRIRDVVIGPDNQLYITTSNKSSQGGSNNSEDDKIIKVTFAEQPTQIPLPTAITPTLYCLGASCPTPPEDPTPTHSTVPTTPVTQPTGANPTTTQPSPTTNPCPTVQTSDLYRKHKKKKNKGGNGFIKAILKFIIGFIDILLRLIFGNTSNPNIGNPINPGNPGNPVNPVNPTINPLDPCAPTAAPQPTAAPANPTTPPQPTQPAQPTTPAGNPTPGPGGPTTPVAPTPSTEHVPVGSKVEFVANYNGGTISPWETVDQCPPTREVKVVSDFVREGGFALKTSVTEAGCGSGNEQRATVTSSHPGVTIREGDERWYEWSMMVEHNFAVPQGTRNAFNVMQWGNTSDSAPLAILISNTGQIQIGGEGVNHEKLTITSIRKGEWVDLVLHVKFSKNSGTGFVEAWENGIQTVPKSTRVTMSGDVQSLRHGIIRDDANLDIDHNIWHDNMRITSP